MKLLHVFEEITSLFEQTFTRFTLYSVCRTQHDMINNGMYLLQTEHSTVSSLSKLNSSACYLGVFKVWHS